VNFMVYTSVQLTPTTGAPNFTLRGTILHITYYASLSDAQSRCSLCDSSKDQGGVLVLFPGHSCGSMADRS
jgi:hypothetical protein